MTVDLGGRWRPAVVDRVEVVDLLDSGLISRQMQLRAMPHGKADALAASESATESRDTQQLRSGMDDEQVFGLLITSASTSRSLTSEKHCSRPSAPSA